MYIYLSIYSILFIIPYTNPSSVPPLEVNNTSKSVELPQKLQDQNKTKLLIASEGGSLLSNVSVTLSKESHPMILSLDKELVKNKEKSVVPRKGVKYDLKEDSELYQNMNTLINTTNPSNISISISNSGDSVLNSEKLDKIKIHKPSVLSSKLLDELGEKFENKLDPKVQKMNENSHPDLIMPVVITILVIPMFAIIGYMVVMRGQEAWKNRHYKRMDFLLDGMYND